eukprot:7498943-Alexandrium_andersonii.AAC.1
MARGQGRTHSTEAPSGPPAAASHLAMPLGKLPSQGDQPPCQSTLTHGMVPLGWRLREPKWASVERVLFFPQGASTTHLGRR